MIVKLVLELKKTPENALVFFPRVYELHEVCGGQADGFGKKLLILVKKSYSTSSEPIKG